MLKNQFEILIIVIITRLLKAQTAKLGLPNME